MSHKRNPDERDQARAPESLDRVDAYLSRKAQKDLDPSALVIERADGSWIVSVPDRPPSALGDSFGHAKEALGAMIKAKQARHRR